VVHNRDALYFINRVSVNDSQDGVEMMTDVVVIILSMFALVGLLAGIGYMIYKISKKDGL